MGNNGELCDSYIAEGEYRGRRWRVWRHPELGHLCGYAEIKLEDRVNPYNIMVHGGVTFCDGEWVGFDCAHAGDNPVVCDVEYCVKQCKLMIDQLVGDNQLNCRRKKRRKRKSGYVRHLANIRSGIELISESIGTAPSDNIRKALIMLREEVDKLDVEHRKAVAALRNS